MSGRLQDEMKEAKRQQKLLDHFAGQALCGFSQVQQHFEITEDSAIAKMCYDTAEAMLAERAKRMERGQP
jgi:hypothetical protein